MAERNGRIYEKKEEFILLTKDKNFAESLIKNKTNGRLLKIILFGSGGFGLAAGSLSTGVAGLSGIAGVAGFTSIGAIANPEPISKSLMAVVAGICFSLGSFYVYKLVKMLINNNYKFYMKKKGSDGDDFEIEAVPV